MTTVIIHRFVVSLVRSFYQCENLGNSGKRFIITIDEVRKWSRFSIALASAIDRHPTTLQSDEKSNAPFFFFPHRQEINFSLITTRRGDPFVLDAHNGFFSLNPRSREPASLYIRRSVLDLRHFYYHEFYENDRVI